VTAASVRLVRRKDTTWEDVPVTSGKYLDARFHGLWINLGVPQLLPGTYALIVSGSSLPAFGYQMVFDQCLDVPTTCDVLAQDCGAGNGCYDPIASYCRKSAGIAVGQPCKGWDNGECEPGAVCKLDFAGGGSKCARYCDPSNPASPKSCDTLCPNLFTDIVADNELRSRTKLLRLRSSALRDCRHRDRWHAVRPGRRHLRSWCDVHRHARLDQFLL